MALSISQTAALAKIIKPGMRIASMGYPDLIADIPDMPGLRYREDSEAICRRHGLQSRQIPDAESYFDLLHCRLDVYDIVRERGCEILCDLNEPFATTDDYDIVLDVGTVEHCFNIAQAIMNMAEMVKLGGHIIHENPFSCGNHGFFNLNPTFFVDFYEANGFEIECRLVTREGQFAVAPRTQRFKWEGRELNVFALARRLEVKPFVFPTQSKYRKLIPDAGARAEMKEVA
jgi:SAM-dependent methyltransferase